MNHQPLGFHRHSTHQRLGGSLVGLHRGPSRDTHERCLPRSFSAPARPVPPPGLPEQLAAAAAREGSSRTTRPVRCRGCPAESRGRRALGWPAPACRWRSAPPAPPALHPQPGQPGGTPSLLRRQCLRTKCPLPFPPLPSTPAPVLRGSPGPPLLGAELRNDL